MGYRPFLFDQQPTTLARRGLYIAPTVALANLGPARDLSEISPYALKAFKPRVPAEQGAGFYKNRDGEDVELIDGGVIVAGVALAPFQLHADSQMGDMSELVIVLAANQTLQALPRPSRKRVLLQVQNIGGANSANIRFGQAATANSQTIAAGGSSSYLANAVPQNELWVFSTAGTTLWIGYIDSLG